MGGSLSVIENAIYDAWERLSNHMIRSFAVKFPQYSKLQYEHEVTWFDLLVLSKFQIFY